MAFTPLKSSAIAGFDYDETTGDLHITFTGSRTFTFHDVPPEVAQGLATADSPGKYFHEAIKGNYS